MINQEIKFDKNGFDPVCRVFTYNDKVFRRVKLEFFDFYNELINSDCWKVLLENKLVCPTSFSDLILDENSFILEHKKIKVITYPNEWTFDMLKDAALCTLKVLQILNQYGYTLKDGHAYNVLFDAANPTFIDIGSIIKNKSKIWEAKNEFLKSFYMPLLVWSKGYEQLANRFLTDQTARCSEKDFQLILNAIYPYDNVGFKFFKNKSRDNYTKIFDINLSLNSLINLINNTSNNNTKFWGNYHNEYFKNKMIKSTPRFDKIVDIIKQLKIQSILDVASNQGVVSYLILERVPNINQIICIDYDSDAINKCYNIVKQNSIFNEKVHVAQLDFILMQSSYFQIEPQVRYSSDCVLALALTHHLMLSQHKYDIKFILNKFNEYTKSYLLIEFMPLGLWDGTKEPNVPEWYTQEWFECELNKVFTIISVNNLEINRVLYVCKKQS